MHAASLPRQAASSFRRIAGPVGHGAHPGQFAMVTGGSGRMGQAFARALAADGYDLVLVARGSDRLAALAARLSQQHGVGVEVLPADLADGTGLSRVERRLADSNRPVDLLVNNAGLLPHPPRPVADQPFETGECMIAVNVVAVARLTYVALRGMVQRGHGGILNVSSVSGFLPQPQGAVYAATKAFVTSFSETVHCEMRHRGVRVTALCPGFTRDGEGSGDDGSGARQGSATRLPLPDLAWLKRDDVVRDGLAALAAGRALCVPGVAYRSSLAMMRLVPRPLVRRSFTRLWADGPSPRRQLEGRPDGAASRSRK